MKILLTLIGLLNGGYMLLDGVYVILKGKYIGPEKPGPWANLFYKFNIDVFKLGPLFVLLGCIWLVWLHAVWAGYSWAFSLGIIAGILTLWYLPFGAVLSVIAICILVFAREKTGL